MAGDETQPTRFSFVEFTDQSSVANALQYNGVIFGGRPLKINHSNNSIVKPQAKSSEAAQKEIEEAMKRVREAQSLISAAIEPGFSIKFDKILEFAGKEKNRGEVLLARDVVPVLALGKAALEISFARKEAPLSRTKA
ncbi:unnamed protein product [Oppiella nova]|uniref:RRM domain-containing protein n=1 Tax=Oppiella nova TaxID=334625 RepID=A0A7R9MV43_9ACAR|nr:unnamed protein product [Oppiella nova]CAG2184136.1 unnamed protein product [Oppiella nova]